MEKKRGTPQLTVLMRQSLLQWKTCPLQCHVRPVQTVTMMRLAVNRIVKMSM